MARDENIKSFSAVDIERYHKGLLSAEERHALEKAALDDPFLADALEGYSTPGVEVESDLAELRQRLVTRSGGAKVIPLGANSKPFPWLRVAAILVLALGAGLLSYYFIFDNGHRTQVATTRGNDKNNETAKENPAAKGNVEKTVIYSDSDLSSKKIAVQPRKETPMKTGENTDSRDKSKTDDAYRSKPDTVNSLVAGRVAGVTTEIETAKTNNALPTLSPSKPVTGDADANSKNYDNVVRNDKNPLLAEKQKTLDAENYAINSKQRSQVNSAMLKTNSNNQLGYSAPYIFKGKVTDASGNAMPFANISNTRDNVGTYSDARGLFTLVSTDSVLHVQVKSLGFENYLATLRNNVAENKISLQEDKSLTASVLDSTKRNYSRRARNTGLTFEEPEPADGWRAYDSYLANNINIPDNLEKQKKTSGDAVELSFEVNKLGEPVNIKVEKSLCDKCDQEAIRLLKEGPKWKRKARKGRVTVTIPFTP
jgi:hypothetical protein